MSSDFFIIDSIREKLDLKDGLNQKSDRRDAQDSEPGCKELG